MPSILEAIGVWESGKELVAVLPKLFKRGNVLSLEFSLSVKILKEEGEEQFVSECPLLRVTSCGDNEEEARKNIQEAIELFLATCIDMGTLDEVLLECGMKNVCKVKPRKVKPRVQNSRSIGAVNGSVELGMIHATA